MSEESDDLSSLLTPRPGPGPGPAALLAATTGVLRRRAFVRRCARVAGVALVFVLGGAAGWVLKPTQGPEVVTVTVTVTVYQPVAVVLPAPVPEPSPADTPVSPTALELLAEQADTPAEVARLYRAAGDRYLADAGDHAQAVRCYRLYFRHAGDAGTSDSAGDSWLLKTLKSDSRKEKTDAKLDS